MNLGSGLGPIGWGIRYPSKSGPKSINRFSDFGICPIDRATPYCTAARAPAGSKPAPVQETRSLGRCAPSFNLIYIYVKSVVFHSVSYKSINLLWLIIYFIEVCDCHYDFVTIVKDTRES